MSYTKHNFTSGQVLYASQLNDMDNELETLDAAVANIPAGTQGAAGNGIVSIAKTSTAGLVDTYTITMTDGTTSTFTVTNGQDGAAGSGEGGAPVSLKTINGMSISGSGNIVINGVPLEIKSFTASPSKAEVGSPQNVTLAYTLNIKPSAIEIDNSSSGLSIDSKTGSITKNNVSANTTYTLNATDWDNEHTVVSKTAKISFVYKYFYGTGPATAPSGSDIRSNFQSGLGNSSASFSTTTEKTGDIDQYIWFAHPAAWNSAIFTNNNIQGGFNAPVTITVKDAGNNDVQYKLYRSTNPNLGYRTFSVSYSNS